MVPASSLHSIRSSPSSAQTGWMRWRIVALLMALCFISHVNRVGMSVAGNGRIMEQFSFSPTQMGLVYSAFLFVYTVCMIPGGAFIDRFGPRVALAAMGFGSAIFGALTGAIGFGFGLGAYALLTFGVIRGLMGLTTAPLHPGCARSVNDWIPLPQRSWANGLVTGAALLGIACTYRVFGALIDAVDWPGAFLVTAVCTAILTSLWFGCSSAPVRERGGAGDPPAPIGDPPTGMGEAAAPNAGTLRHELDLPKVIRVNPGSRSPQIEISCCSH